MCDKLDITLKVREETIRSFWEELSQAEESEWDNIINKYTDILIANLNMEIEKEKENVSKYYKKVIDPDVVNHILIMPRGFGKRIAIKQMKEKQMKEKEMKIWKTKKQENK